MQETDLRATLSARRSKLVAQMASLAEQVKACDTMLAALSPGELNGAPAEAPAGLGRADAAKPPDGESVPVASPRPEAGAAEENHGQTGPPAAPTESPIAPATDRATRRRRGWLTRRVEQAVADCGEQFSLESVLHAYKTRFGWGRDTFDWGRQTTADIIASTLWKIVRKKSYKVVRRGRGRRPTLYATPDRPAGSTDAPPKPEGEARHAHPSDRKSDPSAPANA